MKKLFLALVMVLGTVASQAQRAFEATTWSDDDSPAHSGFYANALVGAYTGDLEETAFGFGAEVGYRLHLTNGLHWNILSAGWNSGVSDYIEVGDLSNVRIMTGARFITPDFLAGKRMYINFDLGYSINTSYGDMSGFAYNVGLGVNLSRSFSMGVSWDGISKDSYNWGIVGLKLGFNF